MGEGEQKEENKKMVFPILTILVCLGVIASIVLAPNVASLGTDIISVSEDLKDVALNDIVDLDKKTIDNQILKGETITIYVGGEKVSFRLVENDIRAVDFSIRYSSGLTLNGDEARAGIVFYKAIDVIGADIITATFTSGKMHFAIDMPDGKTHYVDALDGTGKSGPYLTYCSDDVKATEEIDQNAAVTIPVNRAPVNVEDDRATSSVEDNATAASTNMPSEGEINTTTKNASEGIVEASDHPSTVSATNTTLNFKSTASYHPNEKSTIIADVALMADYEFSTRSTWIGDMLTTYYDVQGRMESQTGICIELSTVDQIPQDSCTSTDSSTLLGQFMSYMTRYNPIGNHRDTNILFSGKALTGGQCKAYETGTGLSRLLGSSYNGYGCTVVQQTFTQDKNTWMVGHGIALTFNADENWGEYGSGIGSWMWPFYANSELAFEPQNIQRMQTWMGEAMQNLRLVKHTTTTQDGFQISNTRLIIDDRVFQVGLPVLACFEIKNLQSSSVTLPALYFGAVNAKGECKDFGVKSNVVIGPGQTYPYWTYFTPDSSGEWNICPARYYNGNWNWFNVNSDNNAILHPTFYYELKFWEGHLTSAYSTDLFYKWGIYATSPMIGPSQEVMTTFTMFNTAAGTSYTTYNWVFVEVRCPNDVPHDFAGIQNPSLSQRGNGYVGGGIRDVAYTTFDQSGVWKLSPCFQTSQGQWGPWMGPRYINVGIIVLHYGQDNGSAAIDNGYYNFASGDTVAQYLHPDNTMGYSIGLEVMELSWSQSWDCPLMRFGIASTWYKNQIGFPYQGTNWAQEVSIYVGKEQGWDAGVYATSANLPRYLGSSASVSGADIFYQVGGRDTSIGYDFRYPTGNPEQTLITDVAIATTFFALSSAAIPGAGWIGGAGYIVSLLQAANAYLSDGTFIHESGLNDPSAASVKWTGVNDWDHSEQTTYNEVNLRLDGGMAQTYCFSIWADFLREGANSTPELIVYLVP